MPLARRQLLTAGALAPLLASCATDLSGFGQEHLPALAARLDVRAASYVTLDGGELGSAVALSGCAPACAPRADAIFQAASLTKPLIAFAALQLVRNRRLDLRAPVSHYLPDGYLHRQNPFDADDLRSDLVPANVLARIALGTLLNHSAGLPNWTSGPLTTAFQPGTRWQYSGEGYVLLQAVLSAVTGQDIEALVSQQVFGPLGMRSSRMRLTPDIAARVVPGTSWFGGTRQHDFHAPNAAASLYTTSSDYARLMAALLADRALLALTLADPVKTDASLGLTWGHGWGIESATGGPYLWQWGNNPGFRAFAMVSAVSRNGFVLLANSERAMPLAAPLAQSTVPAEHGVFRFHMLG